MLTGLKAISSGCSGPHTRVLREDAPARCRPAGPGQWLRRGSYLCRHVGATLGLLKHGLKHMSRGWRGARVALLAGARSRHALLLLGNTRSMTKLTPAAPDQ